MLHLVHCMQFGHAYKTSQPDELAAYSEVTSLAIYQDISGFHVYAVVIIESI